MRPVLNLRLEKDVKAMRAIAEEAFAMVREYKGSHSGEHGDGIVRSEFHEAMFGSRIIADFREVKQRFDPYNVLNPGKIVDPPRMDDRTLFRYPPDYRVGELKTVLDWSAYPGAGGAIGWTHHAALEFAAGAIVVAHLDRALKAAAGSGISRPVEHGLQPGDAIAGRKAKQRTIVHFGRIDDLAGIEQIVRIEAPLDLAEIGDDALPEHRLVKFRAHDAVAVFAGMRALVFPHHRERLLGDFAHGMDILFLT